MQRRPTLACSNRSSPPRPQRWRRCARSPAASSPPNWSAAVSGPRCAPTSGEPRAGAPRAARVRRRTAGSILASRPPPISASPRLRRACRHRWRSPVAAPDGQLVVQVRGASRRLALSHIRDRVEAAGGTVLHESRRRQTLIDVRLPASAPAADHGSARSARCRHDECRPGSLGRLSGSVSSWRACTRGCSWAGRPPGRPRLVGRSWPSAPCSARDSER